MKHAGGMPICRKRVPPASEMADGHGGRTAPPAPIPATCPSAAPATRRNDRSATLIRSPREAEKERRPMRSTRVSRAGSSRRTGRQGGAMAIHVARMALTREGFQGMVCHDFISSWR